LLSFLPLVGAAGGGMLVECERVWRRPSTAALSRSTVNYGGLTKCSRETVHACSMMFLIVKRRGGWQCSF
jgi:hypothetical protein